MYNDIIAFFFLGDLIIMQICVLDWTGKTCSGHCLELGTAVTDYLSEA